MVGTGDRLTPSHAGSGTKRNRYYISRRLIERSGEGLKDGWRLAASTIEKAVLDVLTETMLPKICDALQGATNDMSKTEAYADQLVILNAKLRAADHILLSKLVKRIDFAQGEMKVALSETEVSSTFGASARDLTGATLEYLVPFKVRRRGVEAKMIIGEREAEPDHVMIKAIARSIFWLEQIREGASIATLATEAGVSSSYMRKMLKLAYLAPPIVETIVSGRQPVEVTLATLIACDLPLGWDDQMRILGFAAR